MTDTRTALLDAGVRLYGSNAADLLKGLSAGAVAETAGFHRQTFYRYWDTQAEYVNDLLRHVLGTDQPPVADGVTVLPSRRGPEDVAEFATELAHHDFERVLQDARARMRIGLLFTGAMSDPSLHADAAAFYEATMTKLAAGYDELLADLGLETADGVTSRDLARTLQAMLLGLVVQSLTVDDEPHGSVLLERATRIVLEGFTEPVDEAEATALG